MFIMPELELTNMVMIQNKHTGKVLVQDRIKSWKGLSFPGGHIEENESVVDSAIREIREETGLQVNDLESCGIIHWLNNKTFDRYFVFLFKTSDYSGDLMETSDEGRNMWISVDELKNTTSENKIQDYLPMFLEDRYNEAYGLWNEDEPWEIIYK